MKKLLLITPLILIISLFVIWFLVTHPPKDRTYDTEGLARCIDIEAGTYFDPHTDSVEVVEPRGRYCYYVWELGFWFEKYRQPPQKIDR